MSGSLDRRLRCIEQQRPDPPVDVWCVCPDDPAWSENAAGERRRTVDLGDVLKVTLTIDRAGEDSEDEQ